MNNIRNKINELETKLAALNLSISSTKQKKMVLCNENKRAESQLETKLLNEQESHKRSIEDLLNFLKSID